MIGKMDKKFFRWLLVASFMGTLGAKLLSPFWAVFMGKLGGNMLDAGIGACIFNLLNGIVIFTLGRTKFYEKRISLFVFLGFTVAGIGQTSYLFCQNKYQLWILQTIIGLAVGCLDPAWDAIFSDLQLNISSARKWAVWQGGIYIVTGAGAVLGGLLINMFGFSAVFIAMGIAHILPAYYSLKLLLNYKK